MPRISDALELLTAQHTQIEDLFDLVATLHDSDALTELADTLTSHLGAEQELLYPRIRPTLAPDVSDELVAEHVELKRQLADLLWNGVEDVEFGAKLEALRQLFDGHAGYQEDELFPRAAEAMTAEQLTAIGAAIAGSATPVFEYARAS